MSEPEQGTTTASQAERSGNRSSQSLWHIIITDLIRLGPALFRGLGEVFREIDSWRHITGNPPSSRLERFLANTMGPVLAIYVLYFLLVAIVLVLFKIEGTLSSFSDLLRSVKDISSPLFFATILIVIPIAIGITFGICAIVGSPSSNEPSTRAQLFQSFGYTIAVPTVAVLFVLRVMIVVALILVILGRFL